MNKFMPFLALSMHGACQDGRRRRSRTIHKDGGLRTVAAFRSALYKSDRNGKETKMVKLLCFAPRVDRGGTDAEAPDWPAEVTDIAALLAFRRRRGGNGQRLTDVAVQYL